MLDSMSEIFAEIERTQEPFWEVILRTNMLEQQISREASLEKMRAAWHAMQEADITYEPDLRSVSGLVGGDVRDGLVAVLGVRVVYDLARLVGELVAPLGERYVRHARRELHVDALRGRRLQQHA